MASRSHIDPAKYLKFMFPSPRKKDNIVRTMKQNHTKHVYFSFFNPLKVPGEPGGGGGGVLPKKMGRGVRPASQNPYPIYEQPAG